MKKNLLLVASALVYSLILTNCGSGSSKRSLPENDILGNLPGIYVNNSAETEAKDEEFKNKSIKLLEDKKLTEIKENEEERNEWKKKNKADFKVKVAEELAKITGRDVPVTYSAALQSSPEFYYTVSTAKIADKDGSAVIVLNLKATKDVNVPSLKEIDFYPRYAIKLKDGSNLETSMVAVVTSKLYKTGDALDYQEAVINFRFWDKLVEFAGIEFITKDEYNAAKARK